MNSITLLAVCLCAGMLLRRTGRFPDSTPKVLNGYVIHLALPALALLHVHRLTIRPDLLLTGLMSWIVFAAAYLFFRFLERRRMFDRPTTAALILVAGLGNTSFVGLPMIEAWYGKEMLGVGVIADQIGTFPALTTLGILVAARYASGGVSRKETIRKILLFPPFQALILALVTKPLAYPEWMTTILVKLGDTVTPLALVSVGYQLRLSQMGGELKGLSIGLAYKLILAPALIALLYLGILGVRGEIIQVTVFEAAMAPMITAGIVAVDHDFNPRLVALLLGVGIPVSFLTLPLWWYLLRAF